MSTLIFEGAGWEKAEHHGVGNCRIRTRIKTERYGVVYLEMSSGIDEAGRTPKGHINHLFTGDDENTCLAFPGCKKRGFLWSKEGILSAVNSILKTKFDVLEVDNADLYVHADGDPILCEG